MNARDAGALDNRCLELQDRMEKTRGAVLLQAQDACAISVGDKFSTKEHFGYTDGFGNPDFIGAERDCVPGQGKLGDHGDWAPLATGEICLALTWSGDVEASRNRAREASTGANVAYLVPREGALMTLDMMGIPADAPHPKNAQIWMNYLLQPEVAPADRARGRDHGPRGRRDNAEVCSRRTNGRWWGHGETTWSSVAPRQLG